MPPEIVLDRCVLYDAGHTGRVPPRLRQNSLGAGFIKSAVVDSGTVSTKASKTVYGSGNADWSTDVTLLESSAGGQQGDVSKGQTISGSGRKGRLQDKAVV